MCHTTNNVFKMDYPIKNIFNKIIKKLRVNAS